MQDLNSSRSFPLTKCGRNKFSLLGGPKKQSDLTVDGLDRMENKNEEIFKLGSSLMRNKGLCHQEAKRLNTSTKFWLQDYDKKKKKAYAR